MRENSFHRFPGEIWIWALHRLPISTGVTNWLTTSIPFPTTTSSWDVLYQICFIPICNQPTIVFSKVSSPPEELAPYLALLLPFDTIVWAWVLASVLMEILLLMLIDRLWNAMSVSHKSSYIYEGTLHCTLFFDLSCYVKIKTDIKYYLQFQT